MIFPTSYSPCTRSPSSLVPLRIHPRWVRLGTRVPRPSRLSSEEGRYSRREVSKHVTQTNVESIISLSLKIHFIHEILKNISDTNISLLKHIDSWLIFLEFLNIKMALRTSNTRDSVKSEKLNAPNLSMLILGTWWVPVLYDEWIINTLES